MADTTKLNIVNSSRVLQKIWRFPGISRIEISEELGMDRSSITKIMNTFLEKKWVVKQEITRSRESLGRKPVGLTINPGLGVLLGIEIQTQNCRGVITDLSGSILLTRLFPFEPREISPLKVLEKLILTIQAELGEKKLLGVGVGLSGVVNPRDGIINLSNPLAITSPYPMARELSACTGLPVLIENDANCCSWGELVYRKAKRVPNFLTVLGEFRSTNIRDLRHPGIAIGLGMVLREEVYYGEDYTAGEFKSFDWKDGGITQFSISNDESYNISQNPGALEKVFRELSRNLALFVNVFNFNKVIFAGDFVYHRNKLKELLQEAVQFNWLYRETKKISIDFSPFEENAVAYGAAGHFLERLFSVPKLESHVPMEMDRGVPLFSRVTGAV